MRILAIAALLPLAAAAQPGGLVRGKLLECDIGTGGGEFSIRAASNDVYRFRFDDHTYFERDNERITPGTLRAGDALEVVSDDTGRAVLRYARTIHVIAPEQPVRRRFSAGRYRLPRENPIEQIAPSGNLTFAGIVARMNDERLVLRTRTGREQLIYLRSDTRYLHEGVPVALSALKPNTRVFIRGSKNLDDDVEAYQVVWGEILQPGQ